MRCSLQLLPAALLALAASLAEGAQSFEAVVDLSSGGWVRRPAAFEDRPLPAGSLFKLATTLAALSSEEAPGSFMCDGARCWLKSGHGRLDLDAALAQSCSSHFAQLSSRLDTSHVLGLARALGFEPSGRLASPVSFAGDEPSLQIRPTRAAMMMAYLATGRPPLEGSRIGAAARERIGRALIQSASIGTASGLLSHLPRAAAKTGTALTAEGLLLGWCAGFVPDAAPRYAFAVVVFGSTARQGAVPEAALLLRDLLRGQN